MQDLVPKGGKKTILIIVLIALFLEPGPLLMQDCTEVYWSVIFSIFFGKH